jgi:hypothetical protein
MNTIARKLPMFILMAAATIALTIGTTTTLAVSNTHAHQSHLIGSWASSFTHIPFNSRGNVDSDDFGDFNSAQYGVQPHHHQEDRTPGIWM